MDGLVRSKAAICIPNYKTLELTRLCLRCIRKFTDYPYEVIVVDNDSADESLDYLRKLKWIRLIERRHKTGEPRGSIDHGAALDLGLAKCNTEFYVVMHSDAVVKKAGWLSELVKYFNDDERIACVGSGKIEIIPAWQMLLKRLTDFKAVARKIFPRPQDARFRSHNRTVCCLYRTQILQKENLSFMPDMEHGLTSGQKLYFDLLDKGHGTIELPTAVMAEYIVHLTHATQAVNPQEFEIKGGHRDRFTYNIEKLLSSPIIQEIIADDSLDR